MAYVKPQVLVYQEFTNTMTSQDTAMRPWIVGRLADIHKRGEAVITEEYGNIKNDNSNEDITMELPELQPGSSVDEKSVKVYADNAILRYAAINGKDETSTEIPYAYSVSGKPNQILLKNLTIKETGNDFRSAIFGKRDVAPDDIVRISAYISDIAGVNDCAPVEFISKIIGYIPNEGSGSAGKAARTTNKNTPTIAGATGTYTGSVADDYYTIHINQSTYSVTSASGKDDYPLNEPLPTLVTGVDPNDNTTPTYTYTFKIGKNELSYVNSRESDEDTLSAGDTISDIHLTSSAFTAASAVYNGQLSTALASYLTFTSDSDKDYSPLASGNISEVFQIQVLAINYSKLCKNIELSIKSNSGYYNRVTQAHLDQSETYWEFDLIPDVIHCQIPEANRAALEIGSLWVFTLTGAYTPPVLTTNTTYTGSVDDTFVITCVSGGILSGATTDTQPKVTIRTLSGSEFRGPLPVNSSDVITSAFGTTFAFSGTQMALGETWVVQAITGKDNPPEGIVLRDAIPEIFRTVGTSKKLLDVDLCVLRDIEVAAEGAEGGSNWNLEGTDIQISSNIKVTSDEFIKTTGEPISLDLLDGSISVGYREWLIDGAEKFNYVSNMEDLDAIPGPLSPENPVKYGVYKALTNSGSRTVVYTTVTGDDLDAWSNAIDTASGSREIYTVVPLSQDLSVLKLVETLVTSDSNEETCAWKNCFLSVAAPSERMLVGQSDATRLNPTSTDGQAVVAKIDTTGFVEITSTDSRGLANADLSEVRPGDVLRVITGPGSFVPYIIKEVSGNSVVVKNAPDADIESGIEIWHTLTRAEQADYIANIAQSFSNRRIKLVWPDVVGDTGNELPGTFLCAALAGLVGGSVPNQGLTRVTISGFDDMSRSIPYFTESQIKKLASSGVWIVMEDLDGTIFTMHGLTTSTVSLQYSEEMITRIVDFMSLELRTILEQYIGVTNITAQTIDAISDDIMVYMGGASSNTYSSNGPLVTEYEILDISQDALLKDRINVILSVTIPKATNNIVLRLQAE